jgi:hypothetical protein
MFTDEDLRRAKPAQPLPLQQDAQRKNQIPTPPQKDDRTSLLSVLLVIFCLALLAAPPGLVSRIIRCIFSSFVD